MPKIKKLLDEIKYKEIVLPEFQREFTWSKTQVRKLFESFYKDYPSGSILMWETEDPPKIKNDAYNLEEMRRVKVLLDGQQRLTSLYLHVYGEIPPYYNSEDIDEDYFDLYFNVRKGEFKYHKQREMDDNPLWKPLTELYKSKMNAFDVLGEVEDQEEEESENMEVAEKIQDNLNKVYNILEKEYPVQDVPNSADIKESIQIFDLINSQGTRLSTADIILAYLTAEWPDIRRIFKDKIKKLEEEEFSFDLTFMTRCLVGIVDGIGDLEQFDESNKKDLQEVWEKLDETLNFLVSFLKNKAYIINSSDLSTPNALVPLVVYLAREGWFSQNEEQKFLYWLYAALYKRRYTSSTDTYLHQDIRSLLKNSSPESLITNLKEDEGEPNISPSSLDMRGVGHPLYNMMNIVIRSKGAVDWMNGLPLKENIGDNFSIERHHIFPQEVLKQSDWYEDDSQYHTKRIHEIANRIPLTKEGNMEIFDNSPTKYLPTVKEEYPETLEKSLVPTNERLWKVENYENFLKRRRALIAEAINSFMDSLISEEEDNEKLEQYLDKEESDTLEYKARLIGGGKNYDLENAVAKTITGMLNEKGGTLIIGVSDNGEVLGIEEDFKELGKNNKDGFQLHLTEMISSKIGSNVLGFLSFKFEKIEGKTICGIFVDKYTSPVYMKKGNKKKFYVRTGNSTRELQGDEADQYKENRFK